jgi:hypothetical protein
MVMISITMTTMISLELGFQNGGREGQRGKINVLGRLV